MNISLLYLFEVSLVLAFTQVVYSVFLKHLTFHQANRFVLIGSLLFSCLAPLISFPIEHNSLSALPAFPASSFPAGFTASSASPSGLPAETSLLANTIKAAVYLYCGGVILFFLQLLLRIVSLIRLVSSAQKEVHPGYTLLLHADIESPFSFYKYIGINKELYSPPSLAHILQHEQIHLRQKHSLDVLLIELYLIFFWFSPFAWRHQKLVTLNLEYLADQGVLTAGFTPENYQLSLLSMSLNKAIYPLTNPFTLSFMKARIRMINQAPSSARSRMNYLWLLVAGVVTLFIAGFTQDHQTEVSSVIWKAQTSTSPFFSGQNRTMKGIVKIAESGKPMKDVQVIIVGTSRKTTTDAEGRFSIEVSEKDQIMEFIPMDFTTIKADNYYPPLAMQITAAEEMIVLLSRFPLSPLKDTTIYFMDGRRISEQEYEKQQAKGYFPVVMEFRPGLRKFNLINMGNVD